MGVDFRLPPFAEGKNGMFRNASAVHAVRMLLLVLILTSGGVQAELEREELNATRAILAKDWLRLKLEVLGLRLSYPAYRIQLELTEEGVIAFTFLASSGLADHLLKKAERPEAEKMIEYHALGIRTQVEKLLESEFPELWAGYQAPTDFKGRFLAPGKKWSDPPYAFGVWENDRFTWEQ